MPTEIDDDLIEFSNGVRLHCKAMDELNRHCSYRRIAEILGISYIEYNEGRALCKSEEFDPPHDPEREAPPKQIKAGYQTNEK